MKNLLLKWVAVVALFMALTSQGFATPVMYLPWQSGKSFQCTQGNNNTFSHSKQLAYAYDLGLPAGEPILASAGGVISSYHDGTPGYVDASFGNFVIINHGDGTYALYAHMQNGSVSQFVHNNGQTIQQGDQIGRCGATGTAYGAHLHIQVMQSSVTSSQTVFFSFAEAGSPTQGQWLTSKNIRVLPNGLYVGNDESGVFLVSGGFRRVFLSADSFNHWGQNWGSIQTVDASLIYGKTTWQPPIPDLIHPPGAGIYWVEDGIARPINSADTFNAMGFSWGDYRDVSQAELNRYPCPASTMTLNGPEPRLIITDGPYITKNAGYVSGGFRIRNLSQSAMPFDVTIRARRSDGWWHDFPWHRASLAQGQEYVNWSDAGFPTGHYTVSVLYSYWANGNGRWGNGVNMQFNAPVAGLNRFTKQQGSFDIP